MYKLLVLIVVVIALVQESLAIKCYFCDTACKVESASERTCGTNIGPSSEAVCTTERTKGSEASALAIRRCQIVTKGQEIECKPDSNCRQCNSDLCNSAPSISINTVALTAMALAYLIPKVFMH